MGIETSPPDVEESTEPPLRPSSATTAEGAPRLVQNHAFTAIPHAIEDLSNPGRESEKSGITDPTTATAIAVTTCTEQLPEKGSIVQIDPPDWKEEYKYAHTFSIAQISSVLDVNTQ
jgi:hypothetical protein